MKHSGNERKGFLIRWNGGFGCVQPWPELGDAPVTEQLRLLAEGKTTPLINRALDCARMDAAARHEKRNLFTGLTVPASHATAPQGLISNEIDYWCSQVRRQGFTTVKLKLRAERQKAQSMLQQWMEADEVLRFRLDFNETGTLPFFEDWLDQMPQSWQQRLDFIEDPVCWSGDLWTWWGNTLPVPAAVDRQGQAADSWGPVGSATWRIVKPALESGPPAGRWPLQRVVFTSYMDHALGQSFAAWEAAQSHSVTAGLMTHHLYEEDAFFNRLAQTGPNWISSNVLPGTGLGFDDLLNGLTWVRLAG